MDKNNPKLRSVNKSKPPFELNKFPNDFPYSIGEQLVYILATRGQTDIEGKEWEGIFAKAIGAEWRKSVIGLDDIVMGNTAWGAKSILKTKPAQASNIRLISGRNDLINSFDYNVQPGKLPDEHGELVLSIYNARIEEIKKDYKHVRTVVLIRSSTLLESVVFEMNAIRYNPELYYWKWNKKNLYGFKKTDDSQKFTWQSGGQQFTIFEQVPEEKIIINIRQPERVPKDFILSKIGFENDWITVTKNY